ncbi:MAG: hypothetical protein HYS70_06175, partial [Nitrospinae bacterium]|nr:hypothetical protein [Nitrospinota bacterium]
MSTPKNPSVILGVAFLAGFLALAWTGLALAADKYAPAPSAIKGWTEYKEPIKDLRDPAHRNPK